MNNGLYSSLCSLFNRKSFRNTQNKKIDHHHIFGGRRVLWRGHKQFLLRYLYLEWLNSIKYISCQSKCSNNRFKLNMSILYNFYQQLIINHKHVHKNIHVLFTVGPPLSLQPDLIFCHGLLPAAWEGGTPPCRQPGSKEPSRLPGEIISVHTHTPPEPKV